MRKKLVNILCLALAITIAMSITVVSAAEKGSIMPRFVGIDAQAISLTINEYGRANCDCSVSAKSGYNVNVTMSLEQDGTEIKSWTGSGSRVDLSKVYYVAEGHDYQVIITSRVYTSGGSYLCSYTGESHVYSY